MKIRIVGGGPAGLLFAYLMKRDDPRHDIRVYERGPERSTYGWGVVLSERAFSFVRDAAPELCALLARGQVVFNAVAVIHRGVTVTLAHTLHRIGRFELLRILHEHCRRVGVCIDFDCAMDDVAQFADSDLIVAADGARSTIRTRYADHFRPTLDERPHWFSWFGTNRLYEPMTLIFHPTPTGLMIAHAYQYSPTHSTFLVEVDPVTFANSRLDKMSEAERLHYCESVFADELQGRRLLSNRSTWFKYAIVQTVQWHYRNIVLIGDALRTGHPSVGSGTRLAMQDSISLFEAYKEVGTDVPAILARFVRIREPDSASVTAAAIKSAEWYESLGPKMHLDPVSFTYDYLLRTGRVRHDDLRKRDPAFALAYERLHPELHFDFD